MVKVTVPLEEISDRLSYDATTNSLQFDLVAVEWVANGFIAVGEELKKDTRAYDNGAPALHEAADH